MATGEMEAAMSFARTRLMQNPGDIEALTMLAAGLALSRNYELSNYYADLALKQQPDNPLILNIKGVATMLAQKIRVADLKKAATYFAEAFDTDARQVAPGLNLGNLYLELGNAKASSEVFEKVVEVLGIEI